SRDVTVSCRGTFHGPRRIAPSSALRAPSPRWGEGDPGAALSADRPRPNGDRVGVRGAARWCATRTLDDCFTLANRVRTAARDGGVALAVASLTVVIHERLGFWARHLRPRLVAWPIRWHETRSTADLEAALAGLTCPVVLIDLGRPRAALEDLDRAAQK